jgi:tripartite-type tricarboxylate transporter receptor subunit TctC
MISNVREAVRIALVAAAVPVAAALLASSPVVAQQPFYKGKRLAVLVNFAPGGSTDIEGRLFARHIARHLEGEPSVVVQNMDGAGGFNGASYVGEVGPRDGTMLGFLGGTAWQFATDPERFRSDLRSYEFIAFQPGTTVYYVRKDVAPGMKQPGDIARATDLIAGGNGVHNARDLLIRLSLDILGVKHRYVTGFRSGQTARLALQRNEVNFYAEPASAYRGAVEAQVIAPGIAIPVYVDPIYNGERLSNSPQVKGLPIPAFQDLYRSIKGVPPSGQLWDVYLSALALTSAMGRLIALPPQAPEAAVTALRNATARLNNDPAFAEDSMKALGFVPDYVTGPDVNRLARQTLTVRPETRAFVADYIKRANK